jgi:hypothetical protein
MFRGQEWPQQNNYTYLGLKFSCTQGILKGIEDLEAAGRRAAMATLHRCRQLHIDDVGTALALFNNQVLPCLLYGAEVWLPYLRHTNKQCSMLSHPLEGIHERLEKVQLLFLKRFLHLRHSTSSWVVLAECGRLPVYMYGFRRVCSYWNKLAQADDQHLARLAFHESLTLPGSAAATCPWAQVVRGMQEDLAIQLHTVPAQSAEGVEAEDVGVPTVPWLGDMVCRMAEVQQAASGRLELWWQQWATDTATPSQLHKYACWFKHRDHLGSKDHYLYDLKMPRQLQRQLLLLRTFNLKLGTHLHRFNPHASPVCRHCGMVEDELHVLHTCSAYSVLRVIHGIPGMPSVDVFDTPGPIPVARYIRACLKLPEHAGSVSTDREGEESDFSLEDGSFVERASRAQLHARKLWYMIRLVVAGEWQRTTVFRYLFLVLFCGLVCWLITHMGLGCLPGSM